MVVSASYVLDLVLFLINIYEVAVIISLLLDLKKQAHIKYTIAQVPYSGKERN